MDQQKLLKQLAEVFKRHNYELFLVGGAVRDQLRHLTPSEFDMATDAAPEEIKNLLRSLRPTDIYTIGAKFGTIGAHFNSTIIEITTYRSEQYTRGSRHPAISFGKTLQEDLSRRDFTINAIAQNLETGEYIDPLGGQHDIHNQIIRVVGNSGQRFREDPLRLLRAVRFATTLHFTIEPHTAALIRQNAIELGSISAERIAQEMDKILLAGQPSCGIRLLADLNLLPYILPEFIPLQTVRHEFDEHKNIYEHTLTVLDRVPATKRLRWVALLHDIGKPQTKNKIQGEVHFFEHELVGERIARTILDRLHYDRAFINDVTKLIRYHLRVNLYTPDWTDGAIKRLMREANDLLDDLITFSYSDITSAREEKVRRGHNRIDQFAARVKQIQAQEEVAKLHSPLTGTDLMTIFKRPAGPWIKPIKEYLLDLVIEGKLKQDDKTTAAQIARAFLKK